MISSTFRRAALHRGAVEVGARDARDAGSHHRAACDRVGAQGELGETWDVVGVYPEFRGNVLYGRILGSF